jgi:hypothetical protein
MVLNPDVNVRSRGVMEKCSLCIQKTQKTILDASAMDEKLKMVNFRQLVLQHVEADAMVFGDINDGRKQSC